MTKQEKGIIIQSIRYTDSSRVIRIFTREHGLKSFLIRTGRKKGEQSQLFHPFGVISFSSTFRETSQMHRANDISRELMLHSIPFDVEKSSIAMFLNEVLSKTLQDDFSHPELFDFIYAFIRSLDEASDCRSFHIWFMIHLCRYYGFSPQAEVPAKPFFDLQEGLFLNQAPAHAQFVGGQVCHLLHGLVTADLDSVAQIPMSSGDRKTLLNAIITYYRIHLEGIRDFKSHKVLEEVFNELR